MCGLDGHECRRTDFVARHLLLSTVKRGDGVVNFKIDMKTAEKEVPIIELEGEVDVYTAPQLKQQMINLLESGAKELVVNLTKVDYLDSTALGVLIGGLKRIREADGNMVLVCPSPRIRRVFEITGLDKIFEIFNAEQEAQEAMGKEIG